MLDTWKIRTTNIKMKLLSPFVGFLIVGLWVSASEADISLTLRNKQYLPPPIQELPIKDDYYNTQKQQQHQQQQQQQQQERFEENKYGNSKYQVFEVHNHYEPSTLNNQKSQQSGASEEIRIQHINAPADFPLDDPNLDASYLSFATGNDDSNQQIIVKHESRNVQTHSNNIPVPFPSNYRHTFPEKSNKNQNFNSVQQSVAVTEKHQTQVFQTTGRHTGAKTGNEYFPPLPTKKATFKGPDYLPPTPQQQGSLQAQNNFEQKYKGPDYLPPTEQGSVQSQQSNAFKGPDYLPPLQQGSVQSQQNNVFKGPDYLPPSQQNSVQTQQNNVFKGPDYLPPHQQGSVQSQQNNAFKGPDYLPPHQQESVQTQQNNAFKGPDYLPPHHQGSVQTQQNNVFKGPDYLPPHQQESVQTQQNNVFKGPDYLPPHQQESVQTQQNNVFKGPDYLPPHQQESVQSQQNNAFKGPDYLPPHQQGSVQTQQNNVFKGPDYLPPHQQSTSHSEQNHTPNTPFKGPDYLPPHQQTQPQQKSTFRPSTPYNEPEFVPPQQNSFKGPDYLPPVQGNTVQHEQNPFRPSAQFKGPDYLPPQQGVSEDSQQINQNHNTPFKGPDYLPPQQQQNSPSNNPFKGPDYLPPYQSKNNAPFKGPDYLPPQANQVQDHKQIQSLPPGYDFQKPANSEQAIAELHTLPEESPQYREVTVQSQIQVAGREQSSDIVYGTPKQENGLTQKNWYLPPGYDFQKPENSEEAIKELHSLETKTTKTPFRASHYLPPGYDFQKPANAEEAIKELHSLDTSRSTKDVSSQTYTAPGYLPPGYDFQKPANAEQTINQLHGNQQQPQLSQNSQNFQGQTFQNSQVTQGRENYQTQAYQTVQQQANFQSQTQQDSKPFKAAEYLPPSNSVQQINQPFKGPDYLPPTTGNQAFKGPDYLPPTSGSQTFKGPDYLPPLTSGQTTVSLKSQQAAQVFKGPDYLPPVNVQQSYQPAQQSHFKGPDYLPPVAPTAPTVSHGFQPTVMYPLSSFMTRVKPNDRYGNRKPFPEYGLPPATSATYFASNDVSPMYREPASRPQYYAPTMSYTNNAFNSQTYTTFTQNQYQGTSTLSQQAREALQTFMPEDLRQTTIQYNAPKAITVAPAKVSTTKSATAKIRTVQIVNPNAVKTLKVLESLDHTGVKTIKILGPSHEEPMGEHRVIKVVSGGSGQEQNVQTVKIFNDHQDVTANVNVGQNQSTNNGYLPPRRKRNPNQKPKFKGRRRIANI